MEENLFQMKFDYLFFVISYAMSTILETIEEFRIFKSLQFIDLEIIKHFNQNGNTTYWLYTSINKNNITPLLLCLQIELHEVW